MSHHICIIVWSFVSYTSQSKSYTSQTLKQLRFDMEHYSVSLLLTCHDLLQTYYKSFYLREMSFPISSTSTTSSPSKRPHNRASNLRKPPCSLIWVSFIATLVCPMTRTSSMVAAKPPMHSLLWLDPSPSFPTTPP